MMDFLSDYYLWIKSLHIISVISWMAAMLYLPRLFVYHAATKPGSEMSETFKVMERKLLRIILNPAMCLAWVFGILMIIADPSIFENGWMHVKATCIILITGLHHGYVRWFKAFDRDENQKSEKFFRIVNEIPAVLMMVIVFMVILKPF